ncbi:hypothetical protein APUTEX25_005823 [Auxenochlorella protothecoides]|uniref:Cleavage and polyadenylation specificity factor subunit 1 n=1 Tax=Auxenochlorella protothecoides TaxID=3075 RepID=A0A3M7L2L2_AUXPR|nr:hypothetical protein APUTEX25_005823 [Auxenochlorella protothecoides]|eukprot:RMZ55782.1 hypothetical protein APUTEX25_005823 [Auxenochlorella protothecoides]
MLIASLTLPGLVESLACIPYRYRGRGRDSILLSFRQAKASVLCWDATSAGLVTSSLHYFEADEAMRGGRAAFTRGPLAAGDPLGRCGAVVVYDNKLAVLPAMVPELLELDEAAGLAGAGRVPEAGTVGNSYVDDLGSALDIQEVKAATFLHGYSEPVLLVLHEPRPSWSGALRDGRDTCVASALSLSLARRTHACIWSAPGLPTDARGLAAVPSGGALVLCRDGVVFVAQGQSLALLTNPRGRPGPAPPPLVFDHTGTQPPGNTAAAYARAHLQPHPATLATMLSTSPAAPGLDVECDTGALGWLTASTAFLSVKTGQLVMLRLERTGGAVNSITMTLAGASPPATCLASVGPSLLFLGSALGDSLLVRAEAAAAAADAHSVSMGGQGGAPSPHSNPELSGGEDEEHILERDGGEGPGGAAQPMEVDGQSAAPASAGAPASADDEEDEAMRLYGMSLGQEDGAGASRAAEPMRYALSVLDALINVGPIHSITMADVPGERPFLLTCSGSEKTGALCMMRPSVTPTVITRVPLPGVLGLWAVWCAKSEAADGKAPASAPQPHHSYLVMSFKDGTKLLATGDELREATDVVEFAVDTRTLAAGSMAGGRLLLQVFPQGLRTLRGTEMLVDHWAADLARGAGVDPVDPGVSVLAAHITDTAALVRLSCGALALLRLDPDSLALAPVRLGAAQGGRDDLSQPDGSGPLTLIGSSAVTAACLASLPAAGSTLQRAIVALCREGGALEVYDADTWELVLREEDFVRGKAATEVLIAAPTSLAALRPDLRDAARPSAVAPSQHPYLLALLSDGTLLAYRAFWTGGQLRFKRLLLDGMGEDLACSGFLLAGAKPLLLVASRNTLVPHPFGLGQHLPLAAFTPFHNVNCPFGFVASAPDVARSQGGLHIGQLPPRTRLDGPWARQKIALRATPLQATFYPEASLIGLLVCRHAPYTPAMPEEDGSEPHAAYSYALADAAAAAAGPAALVHEVRLLEPGSWDALWRHALLPGERALVIRTVRLREARTGATVPFLAVGAGFLAGEDYPCGGRVLLCEIRRGAGGRWQSRMAYAREFKAAVCALDVVEGGLLVATGNRLELCLLLSSAGSEDAAPGAEPRPTLYKLQRCAFYDGPVLITSLQVIKKFILLADILLGLSFLTYSTEARGEAGGPPACSPAGACRRFTRQFVLLSKDAARVQPAATALLVSGKRLHLVMAGLDGTLRMLGYDPTHANSWKGQRLVHRASLHTGEVMAFMAQVDLAALRAGALPSPAPTWGVLVASASGAVGLVVGPSWDGADAPHCPPASLARALACAGPAPAGLNAVAWRRRGRPDGATMLDCGLLATWTALDLAARERVASDLCVDPGALHASLAALHQACRLD